MTGPAEAGGSCGCGGVGGGCGYSIESCEYSLPWSSSCVVTIITQLVVEVLLCVSVASNVDADSEASKDGGCVLRGV